MGNFIIEGGPAIAHLLAYNSLNNKLAYSREDCRLLILYRYTSLG